MKQHELQKDDSRLIQYLQYFEDDDNLSDQLTLSKLKESDAESLIEMKEGAVMSIQNRLLAFNYLSVFDMAFNDDLVDFKLIITIIGLVVLINVIIFKFLCQMLIEWDPIEGNSVHDEFKKD